MKKYILHASKEEQQKRYNKKRRLYNRKLRLEIIKAYGNECACCGEKTLEFLAIDHINGSGKKHRKELRATGTNLNSWLKKNNFPKGYQILCHNCNLAKGFYGKCPHKRKKK